MKDSSTKYEVLCFLDHDQGRDMEIMMPLVYFAEKYLSCKIEFVFIWEAHKIYLKKPDIVLLPNTVGSPLYFEISKYAYQQNIPIFALISEGNFRTDGTFDYWGYNKDRIFYQEYVCHWSQRTCDFLSKKLPQQKDKMVVTGGTGFDRYKIYKFLTKEEFLSKRRLSNFTKVIGYAGWAFGKLNTPEGRQEMQYLLKDEAKGIHWMQGQMFQVEEILKKTIENNPDILFILKRHPNEVHPHRNIEGTNEMNRLQHYNNVLYIRDEENIHDLISISDIWMAFESTTVIESWLMNPHRPTLYINPDPDFKRDKLYQGTAILPTYEVLQNLIDSFYKRGFVEEFETEEKKIARDILITNTIGFGDGMNHIRAGKYLEKVIQKIPDRKQKNITRNFNFFIKYWLLHIGKYFYVKKIFKILPKFKKTIWIFDRYKLRKIPYFTQKYYPYLDRFHSETNVQAFRSSNREI